MSAKKLLRGRRVVVTRTSDQAGSLNSMLEAEGAEVLELPLITVTHDADPKILSDIFAEIATYEWIVFTSVNGVNAFFEYFYKAFSDIRCIGPMRIACVGVSTKKAVKKHHLCVDLVPEKAVAEALAAELIEKENVENIRVLVVTGNRNRDALPNILQEQGLAIVDILPVYRTDFNDLSENKNAVEFRQKGADVITFTSSSTVESFASQAKHFQLESGAKTPKACSIGPITSETMKQKGMPLELEANQANLEGLVEAVVKVVGRSS